MLDLCNRKTNLGYKHRRWAEVFEIETAKFNEVRSRICLISHGVNKKQVCEKKRYMASVRPLVFDRIDFCEENWEVGHAI